MLCRVWNKPQRLEDSVLVGCALNAAGYTRRPEADEINERWEPPRYKRQAGRLLRADSWRP